MSVETLLNQLEKVSHKGGGRYLARCPAHPDKTPSLSIREESDGTILCHCFAGCEVSDILSAVGLEMGELFPDKDQHSFDDSPNYPPPRETRGEANLAHIQIRHLEAGAMIDAGMRLTAAEKKQAADDYQYLKRVGKLL